MIKGYLSQRRTANSQAREPSLLAHTVHGTTGIFSQRAGDLASLGGCACAFEVSLIGLR